MVDGEVIFSKHEKGRFPDPEEILDLIRSRAP
jgi:predicted Rdx family selenoprotein